MWWGFRFFASPSRTGHRLTTSPHRLRALGAMGYRIVRDTSLIPWAYLLGRFFPATTTKSRRENQNIPYAGSLELMSDVAGVLAHARPHYLPPYLTLKHTREKRWLFQQSYRSVQWRQSRTSSLTKWFQCPRSGTPFLAVGYLTEPGRSKPSAFISPPRLSRGFHLAGVFTEGVFSHLVPAILLDSDAEPAPSVNSPGKGFSVKALPLTRPASPAYR
jgi:hypothetical protein